MQPVEFVVVGLGDLGDIVDRRRAVSLLARIGISIGLMVFLFARAPSLDTSELLPDWDGQTPFWLLGAFGLTMLAFVMATLRWRAVLVAFDIEETTPRLFSHYMAGQFVSNFVPTTVGGDVVRVRRLTKDSGDGPGSFGSVVFERLSGWVVLPAFTFVGLAVNPGLRDLGAATSVAIIAASVTFAALVITVYVVGHDVVGRRLERRMGIAAWLNALHLGLDKFREHRRSAIDVIVAAAAYQFVLLLAAGCAVEAMGIDEVGMTALLAFLPAVLIVQVAPVSIGGLGIREGALVLFLGRLGVADERAIALGLMIYFLTLGASLIGLPALMFGGRPRNDEPAAAPAAPTPDASLAR